MTDAEIRTAMAAVLRGIAPEADLSEVGPQENLREAIDLDSIDFLHFLVGLHEETGVEIPESDYNKLTTPARIIEYIQSAQQQRA